MKCNDARTFCSQIAAKSVSMQIPQADLDYLSTSGYVSVMPKADYDQAQAEVSNLTQMNLNLQNEVVAERQAETALHQGEKKTHSILFHFEGGEKKQAELQNVQDERVIVLREQTEITQTDSRIKELILKKSTIDRMVPYDGQYVSLTTSFQTSSKRPSKPLANYIPSQVQPAYTRRLSKIQSSRYFRAPILLNYGMCR